MSQPRDPKVQRTDFINRLLLAALLLGGAARAADDNPFVPVRGGSFSTALPAGAGSAVHVPAFLMQSHPVTNAEFLTFVNGDARWRRGAVPTVMADADYLSHWSGPLEPGAAAGASQPVTRVSWFAAAAYCDAQQARLPRWYEWEFAAAASPDRPDARGDATWRQQVLDWYAQPAGNELRSVRLGRANLYGIHDLHGLVWEWVEDFNSLLPADADPEKFCGSGAQNLQQKENYAVLMRIALLGSLHGADTGHSLGFRCVRDAPGTQ